MNIDEWKNLPPDEFAAKLRDAQMSREQYDARCEAIAADEAMEAMMRAAGKIPTALPEGKLGDSASYGVPRIKGEDSSS